MSKRMGLLIVAALAALIGTYQFTPTHADDELEFDRGNCVEGQKCG